MIKVKEYIVNIINNLNERIKYLEHSMSEDCDIPVRLWDLRDEKRHLQEILKMIVNEEE